MRNNFFRISAAALLAALPASVLAAGAPAATHAAAVSDYAVFVYPALLLLFVVLLILDVWLLVSRGLRAFGRFLTALFHRHPAAVPAGGGVAPPPTPENEVCPTCGEKLMDGECPQGHTIVRCQKCQSILKDGLCPRCGVTGEAELCPTCGSELQDGECPRGHTIVRCPDCGSILLEGVCPRGCNADPLNLGWPGGAEKKLSAYALQVVACPKSEGQGFTLRVPESFVIGRSSADAKDPFVELLTITRKEKAQCSRQYVRMTLDPNGGTFTVTLLNSSRNPAFVDGRKLVMKDEATAIGLGGRLKLNPGYELELVEAPEQQ